MQVQVRKYRESDAEEACAIWNTVVEEGNAFPQMACLGREEGNDFFLSQSYTGIAFDAGSGEIVGLYILHPNNVGRCGHICNASYAVKTALRGQQIGEKLVRDCMDRARDSGFRILQFNAVVRTNEAAMRLYRKLGFTQLGVIPGGFLMKDGQYADIIPQYHVL